MYRISVLVPMYGVEKYITRCAESLFSQDYQNVEFVFVNDCTPDKSVEVLCDVLDNYPERKPQVRIINHEKNRGSAAARNTLLDNATGEFVTWVDADDWLEKNAISLMVDRQIETNADIVTGWSYEVDNDGTRPFLQPTYQTREEMLDNMWEHSFNHALWGRIIRKKLYDMANNRCEEGVNQSEDFWMMLPVIYYSKHIAVVEEFVYYYNRANETSQCFDLLLFGNTNRWKQDKRNHLKTVAFFSDKEEKFKQDANKSAIQYLRRMLLYSVKCNDKLFFNENLMQIKSEYVDYFEVIHFNNPLYRSFVSNYFLYSSFLQARSFVWRKIVRPLLKH